MTQFASSSHDEEPNVWVFGYGSLIWNPGFKYDTSRKAYAPGWARRMYQGNTYHRGDHNLPGRVATILENSKEMTNGMAFQIRGKERVAMTLEYLQDREVDNGYEFCFLPIQIQISGYQYRTVQAVTCIARVDNAFYLGEDSIPNMAQHIVDARGRAGPNCEYVIKLAEHVRKLFPEDEDEHLFGLEHHIRLRKSASTGSL